MSDYTALMLVEPAETSLDDVILRLEREVIATYHCKHTQEMKPDYAEGRLDGLYHALHYLDCLKKQEVA